MTPALLGPLDRLQGLPVSGQPASSRGLSFGVEFQRRSLQFSQEWELQGRFATADFSERLDMLTMRAIGIALFLKESCLRPGS
jgi:hypothetical protein